MPHSHRSNFSRRRFLRAFGAVAGAAAATPLFAGESALLAPSFSGRLRVGVALPAFGEQQHRTTAWLAGLGLALDDGAEVEIEPAGACAPEVGAAAVRLLQRNVHVVVGAVTPAYARDVAGAFDGSDAVFLNAEPGAHIVRSTDGHAQVFHHSLHAWQASYATGAWAAGSAGYRRAATVASFRESGYDTLAAFRLGLESAGGAVVSQQVSGIPGRGRSVAECLEAMRCDSPDFVYAAGLAAEGAVSAPLSRTGGKPEAAFAARYGQRTGHAADAYALLGYEAGGLLLDAAQQAREQGLSLSRGLAGAAFQGPRGWVRMNAATRTTTAEAFVDAAGAPLAELRGFDEQRVLAHPAWHLAVSGWAVPYAA
jgi:ABC-type branched-subunit amino acid transport system substrate-binding protein